MFALCALCSFFCAPLSSYFRWTHCFFSDCLSLSLFGSFSVSGCLRSSCKTIFEDLRRNCFKLFDFVARCSQLDSAPAHALPPPARPAAECSRKLDELHSTSPGRRGCPGLASPGLGLVSAPYASRFVCSPVETRSRQRTRRIVAKPVPTPTGHTHTDTHTDAHVEKRIRKYVHVTVVHSLVPWHQASLSLAPFLSLSSAPLLSFLSPALSLYMLRCRAICFSLGERNLKCPEACHTHTHTHTYILAHSHTHSLAERHVLDANLITRS